VVLAAEHHVSHLSLDGVVIQWHPRVVEEDRQPVPQLQHVLEGLAKRAVGQRLLSQRPRLDALDEGSRLLLAHGEPMGQRILLRLSFQRMPVGQVLLNGIQLADEFHHLLAGGLEFERLHEFAPHVRPTSDRQSLGKEEDDVGRVRNLS
jgi:hypothetical protein